VADRAKQSLLDKRDIWDCALELRAVDGTSHAKKKAQAAVLNNGM
jgi:hypothetical protein